MNISIELPETMTIESRKQTVELAVGKLSADIIAKAVLHGLKQKVADAAASAKKVAEESDGGMTAEEAAVSLMQPVVEMLESGDWGRERAGGGGLSERDTAARIIVGGWFRDQYAKGTPERDEYNDADTAGKYAMIDKIWADNEKAFAKAVDAEVKAREEARERKAALSGDITVNI